ncbi:Xaa-Pro peptidase family protein [Thalassobaculum sp. OXR-137]|uniref:M24 family metallopeptidase n=1 Tax=Thalassobaculum sp. OXR-137 TaxID=3100173 RepID=UPI002AC8C974|nr:Xaa-Pro peptidase family protein [Thalassobaculum sp. OXR-137]WPZ36613.1 Xaa-Pro peptidase family protein [Thalassobaculum sp. OXR-137]
MSATGPAASSVRPFEDPEYDRRLAAARHDMAARGLDALIVFAQESLYYLFGYDGGGYVFFQCAVLHAEDRPTTLLCRRPDVAQARDISRIDEVRVWLNAEGANPARDLLAILKDEGLEGSRVGIETDSYSLTGFNCRAVYEAAEGVVDLVEASGIVRGLRVVKSPAELNLMRRAAELADAAVTAIARTARPGVLDSTLTAAAMTAMLEGGGDMPPAGPLVNSGSRAVYGRGVGGARGLSDSDLVMVELAGTYRRYNACIERCVVVGAVSDAQASMHALVRDTLEEMLEAFRPGEPLGRIDEIHRARLDAAGYADVRYAACGYSLGATYRPSWMDVPPMIYAGNPLELRPGMVFFPHVMLGDTRTGLAMGLGETVVVTDGAPEVLSGLLRDLVLA